MAIVPIGTPSTPITTPPAASGASSADGGGFSDALTKMIQNVEESGQTANDAVSRMLDGTGDVHEAMIALQQEDMALHMAVQVRNKLVSAYQEIMRMPV
jgi:flagellar hook-basal body complex protein FliE